MTEKEYLDNAKKRGQAYEKLKGLLYGQVELIAKKSQKAGAVRLLLLSYAMCKVLEQLEKIY